MIYFILIYLSVVILLMCAIEDFHDYQSILMWPLTVIKETYKLIIKKLTK